MSHRAESRAGVPRPDIQAIAVLDGIRVSWEWLCTPPHPVTLEAAALAGLSTAPLPLDEVRARLLHRGCPREVRDGVWAYLIGRSRGDGPTWTVACAGMALPMLAAVCRTLCGGYGVDRDDVASGIVTGFVAALAQVDLKRPGLAAALRWAAVRGGYAVLRAERDAPRPTDHDRLLRAALTHTAAPAHCAAGDDDSGPDREETGGGNERGPGLVPAGRRESAPPPVAGGHPDLVLAAAVADGVLSVAEATLIGETRLEAVSLARAAAARGRPVGAVTMQRLRAEMRLIDHLRPTAGFGTGTGTGAPERPAIGDTGTGAGAAGGRGRGRPRHRQRRPRTVTGHRPGTAATAGPEAPGCGREQSPTVSSTQASRRRRCRPGQHGDGQVAR